MQFAPLYESAQKRVNHLLVIFLSHSFALNTLYIYLSLTLSKGQNLINFVH